MPATVRDSTFGDAVDDSERLVSEDDDGTGKEERIRKCQTSLVGFRQLFVTLGNFFHLGADFVVALEVELVHVHTHTVHLLPAELAAVVAVSASLEQGRAVLGILEDAVHVVKDDNCIVVIPKELV